MPLNDCLIYGKIFVEKEFMKKILSILTILSFSLGFAQLENISGGERLIYRIHYGALNAGTATLTTLKTNYQGVPHFYVKGVGRTTGPVRTFFKVEDVYESYINISTGLPSYYIRNVREGGYSQHLAAAFNQNNQTVILTDKKNPENGSKVIKTVKGLQDMISAFYYLRGLSPEEIRVGTVKNLNVWIDKEMFGFNIRIVGIETINTKYGKLNCLKILPTVKGGRVFKNDESVVLWVSNDQNHIPIAIKAELVVGSLRADIDGITGLKYPLKFIK